MRWVCRIVIRRSKKSSLLLKWRNTTKCLVPTELLVEKVLLFFSFPCGSVAVLRFFRKSVYVKKSYVFVTNAYRIDGCNLSIITITHKIFSDKDIIRSKLEGNGCTFRRDNSVNVLFFVFF